MSSRNYFKRALRDESGMTLMDTMILGSILLVLITALASYQFQRAKQNQARDTLNVYKQLQSNMKAGTMQTQSIGKSEELGFDNISNAH